MPGRPPSVPTSSMLYLDGLESETRSKSFWILDSYIRMFVDSSLLYDVFQRSDICIVEFGEVGFDIIVEINLKDKASD